MHKFDGRGVFLSLILLGIAMPWLALIPVAAALVAQGILGTFNLAAAFSRREGSPVLPGGSAQPLRFSVHLAIHQEPPAVVSRTLQALAAQVGAPDYEVIVLDNNTADPALWRPVEALCATLGPAFRFYHEDGVEGAKAGALNIALDRTDPAASHVIVVDADYVVEPDFLAIAARELRSGGEDFLQFPQAYRNDAGPVAGLSLELADYFLRHARKAQVAGAMLLTGTLSVIRRSALEQAGGWSGRTITEDAELGLRLRRLGFRGRFVDRPVGRGILPLDLAGLSQQRYRWAAGNLDTIRCGFSGLSPRTAVQVFSQLTAWNNLALPLAAGLIGGVLAMLAGGAPEAALWLTTLSGLGLAMVYLSVCLPLVLVAAVRGSSGAATVLSALASRITMILPSAIGTVDALLNRSGAFRRTAKDASEACDAVGPILPLLAAFGGLALLAVPQLSWAGALGLVLLILPYPLALGTGLRLSEYRRSLAIA
ncbi:MAG: glycosyltransferase family 2 protein [Roseovarius sp.]|uniref:glycosyltransferase family 2 protein n=1 Tax=Roseovarius sp. TaxID=1486281 RepID=UPI0032ECF492